MKYIITILLLIFCCSIFGQNRIPQNGEIIVFYPLNKGNEIAKEEYDCFYSFYQVTAKGKYDFKSKFRFKKNTSDVTPSSEIEGYTFYVENQETISEKDNEYLLLFLTRNEDKERIILRVPKFLDKKSNAITQSFYKIKSDYDLYHRKKYSTYIVLPFINAETLTSLKDKYKGKEIIYGIKKMLDVKSSIDKESDLKEITRKINGNYYNFFSFEYDYPYDCSDLDFFSVSNDLIYKQLCASIQITEEDVIFVPVTYLVGNTDFYDKIHNGVYCFFDYNFYERSEYLRKGFSSNRCLDVVNKFTGKKVYYGLNRLYKYKSEYSKRFEGYENRVLGTDELYTIKEGEYDCLRFDIIKRYDYDYRSSAIPYAILRDSLGIEFRVPASLTVYSSTLSDDYTKNFEEYFVFAELADSIIQQRAELKLKKELAEKEFISTLIKKYGKADADYLLGFGIQTIKRFETLAKKYGKVNAKLIINGEVRLGWSKDMCRESWGKPHDINTTTGSWGVHEQWVYEYSFDDSYSIYCLYFENGVLTTIQD